MAAAISYYACVYDDLAEMESAAGGGDHFISIVVIRLSLSSAETYMMCCAQCAQDNLSCLAPHDSHLTVVEDDDLHFLFFISSSLIFYFSVDFFFVSKCYLDELHYLYANNFLFNKLTISFVFSIFRLQRFT